MGTRYGLLALVIAATTSSCSSATSGSSGGSASATGKPFPTSRTAGPPEFGTTRTSKAPPISGGTLAITDHGATAVVADPDRDRVYLVDLGRLTLIQTIPLDEGDEPGRVAVDGARRAHVALRRGGAIVTIDLASASILSRRDVCPAPRGIAYDPAADQVHVACATGELVSLPAAGGAPVRTLHPDLDLRDVVVAGTTLFVSRFRNAEVLAVAADGAVSARRTPPSTVAPYTTPNVAWRMIPRPSGGNPWVVHQRASGLIDNGTAGSGARPAYYSGDACSSSSATPPAVATAITDFGDRPRSIAIPSAVLPVDLAASPDGSKLAVVAAGNGHTDLADALFTFDASTIDTASPCIGEQPARHTSGQLISVAWKDDATVVAYAREPAALFVVPTDASRPTSRIVLSSLSVEDTGHAIFHSNTGASVACASCHAEGGDDAQVWTFTEQGRRRTPSLKGTIAGTAPYHWSGDLANVTALVHRVYEEGMSGPELAADQDQALQSWLFKIPRPPASSLVDVDAASRGKALFEGQGGCTGCHAGDHFTNNTTVDVGTGGAFQVPSLIGVSHRAPFLHTGCALTLADRFGPCGGGTAHGGASGFSPSQKGDLVAYLSTL
jgi:mono/diheme cytochrome c family protein